MNFETNNGDDHHDGANQDDAENDRYRNGGNRRANRIGGPNNSKPRPNSGVFNNQSSGGGGYKDRNFNRTSERR